jgi:signal transduction histidine kinase
MKRQSIRQKMTSFAAIMISSVLVVFIAFGTIMSLFSVYHRFSDTKKRIETALLDKGMTLVFNNSLALRGMAEENAFGGIREIVAATVNNDSSMVYGIYMDTTGQPWVFATRDHLDGIVYNVRSLDDTISRWAKNLDHAGYRHTAAAESLQPHIAFAAPVYGSDGRKQGSIRYGIATAPMKEAIVDLQRRAIFEGAILSSVFILIAALMFVVGRRFIARQTAAITHPIEELTMAATDITHGDYSKTVRAVSNDEIGELARNFDTMRRTVKKYTEELEAMVAQRTSQLEAAQKELVEKAHKAGMADIATGTLHNVGNILNSVRISVEAIADELGRNPLRDLSRANDLIRTHEHDLGSFLAGDSRGAALMRYYLKIETPIRRVYETVSRDIRRVIDKVNDIGDVITAQQSYAGLGGLTESISIRDLVEDALTIHTIALDRDSITIVRHYENLPPINVQKSKFMHVLFNVIKNAREAMEKTPPEKKMLTISIRRDGDHIRIAFADTGCGILPENLKRIFSYGFTTKREGHGFGLHSSANYIKEMGGLIWAESKGKDLGSAFIIKIPGNTKDAGSENPA